jgi:putative oxidoreductase
MNSSWSEIGWAFTRFIFGCSLALFHGYGKVFEGKVHVLAGSVAAMGFPAPTVFAWAASISEFLGGILVALGLFTRPAATACAVTMLVALYQTRMEPLAKNELALLYLAVMVLAILFGGGRYSLDRILRVRSPIQRRTLF